MCRRRRWQALPSRCVEPRVGNQQPALREWFKHATRICAGDVEWWPGQWSEAPPVPPCATSQSKSQVPILPRLSKKGSRAFTSLPWREAGPLTAGQPFTVAADLFPFFILRGVYYEQHGPIVEVSILGERIPERDPRRAGSIILAHARVAWPTEVSVRSRIAHGPTGSRRRCQLGGAQWQAQASQVMELSTAVIRAEDLACRRIILDLACSWWPTQGVSRGRIRRGPAARARFPGTVALAAEYGTAQATTQKAVVALRAEGWLRLEVGQGNHVTGERP